MSKANIYVKYDTSLRKRLSEYHYIDITICRRFNIGNIFQNMSVYTAVSSFRLER